MADIQKLREEIDQVDREIIDRLNRRVQLAVAIGHEKLQSGQEIYVPSREEQVFGKLTASNQGPLPEAAIRRIYREIISAARALEKPLSVAYLGPEATYTHQAAQKNFGSSTEFHPFNSVPDVFTAVKRGEADYGVVPIENSTQGTVTSSLDTLAETELKIVAQIYLEIAHCLISRSSLDQIESVHSKDNALGQCRQWLARMLPDALQIECSSTSAAVLLAKETPKVAAIGSRIAAELYEVPIVAENISDKEHNITRFLVIGKESGPPTGEGKDKTTLLFSLKDEPGAILKAVETFSKRGINMSKLESRPSRRQPWSYFFYVDIQGHIEDPGVKEAVSELEQLCPMVKWLGSYPDSPL